MTADRERLENRQPGAFRRGHPEKGARAFLYGKKYDVCSSVSFHFFPGVRGRPYSVTILLLNKNMMFLLLLARPGFASADSRLSGKEEGEINITN